MPALRNTIKTLFLFSWFMLLTGCSKNQVQEDSNPAPTESIEIPISWSIPENEVLGPYAPFPLVTKSSFVSIEEVSYPDNHLVALISLGPGELRAYPNAFIGLYEIINDAFEDKRFAVTHCPQTASTICWDRRVGSDLVTLRASGYLYNENLMPTDVESGTIWSQMLMRGVSGTYDYVYHNTYNTVETDWETVREQFPHAKIYNETIGDSEIADNVETDPTDREYYRYGILSGINNRIVHIFSYELFDQIGLKAITTTISGKKVIVVGNKDLNFISSYFVDNNRTYSPEDDGSLNFRDDQGNLYNAMGIVLDGPDKNLQLESPKAYTAAWAAWQDFFDDFKIYE